MQQLKSSARMAEDTSSGFPTGSHGRVAKCHRYGGYIRVKKMEGCGKKSGRIHSSAKLSIVLSKFEQLL